MCTKSTERVTQELYFASSKSERYLNRNRSSNAGILNVNLVQLEELSPLIQERDLKKANWLYWIQSGIKSSL